MRRHIAFLVTLASFIFGLSEVHIARAGSVASTGSASPTASYIVMLHSFDDIDAVVDEVNGVGGVVTSVYRWAVGGFAARLSDTQVLKLLADPRVAGVSRNKRVRSRAATSTEALNVEDPPDSTHSTSTTRFDG